MARSLSRCGINRSIERGGSYTGEEWKPASPRGSMPGSGSGFGAPANEWIIRTSGDNWVARLKRALALRMTPRASKTQGLENLPAHVLIWSA
jgi:hypothetical protein